MNNAPIDMYYLEQAAKSDGWTLKNYGARSSTYGSQSNGLVFESHYNILDWCQINVIIYHPL